MSGGHIVHARLQDNPVGMLATDGHDLYVAAVTDEDPPREVRLQLTLAEAAQLIGDLVDWGFGTVTQ